MQLTEDADALEELLKAGAAEAVVKLLDLDDPSMLFDALYKLMKAGAAQAVGTLLDHGRQDQPRRMLVKENFEKKIQSKVFHAAQAVVNLAKHGKAVGRAALVKAGAVEALQYLWAKADTETEKTRARDALASLKVEVVYGPPAIVELNKHKISQLDRTLESSWWGSSALEHCHKISPLERALRSILSMMTLTEKMTRKMGTSGRDGEAAGGSSRKVSGRVF